MGSLRDVLAGFGPNITLDPTPAIAGGASRCALGGGVDQCGRSASGNVQMSFNLIFGPLAVLIGVGIIAWLATTSS